MATKADFEGKIIVIAYTESDYDDEGTAALVYKVVDGKLRPLYGVLNLPDGCSWNYYQEQYRRALAIIQKQGVTDVYAPYSCACDEFFGLQLTFDTFDDVTDEYGAIINWSEFEPFMSNEFPNLLHAHGIILHHIDPHTFEVVESHQQPD